jgi:hypothetical protein
MKIKITDSMLDDAFPPPPVNGNDLLVPITTWVEMFRETQVTGIELEEYWLEHVEAGVAYFFRWLGKPRSTVLVIWNDEGPTYIECRTFGDSPVSLVKSESISAEVIKLFRDAGFWLKYTNH